MPVDSFQGQEGALTAYRHAATITPHDTNELAVLPRALMSFTTAGVAKVVLADDATASVTTVYLPLGVAVPVRARIVRTTDTTAVGITALW